MTCVHSTRIDRDPRSCSLCLGVRVTRVVSRVVEPEPDDAAPMNLGISAPRRAQGFTRVGTLL